MCNMIKLKKGDLQPFPIEPFDILFDKQITGLHLDESQVGDSLDRMFDSFPDYNRIASADN